MSFSNATALETLANISSQTQQQTQQQTQNPTQQSILVADTSQECDMTKEQVEDFLQRHIALVDDIAEEHGLSPKTVFLALFACRGDVRDARRFLLGDFAGLQRPPLPKDGLLCIFHHNSFPPS